MIQQYMTISSRRRNIKRPLILINKEKNIKISIEETRSQVNKSDRTPPLPDQLWIEIQEQRALDLVYYQR